MSFAGYDDETALRSWFGKASICFFSGSYCIFSNIARQILMKIFDNLIAFVLQVAAMQVELEELQPQLVETAAENEKMLTVCAVEPMCVN